MFGWTQIIVRTDDYQTNLLCNSKVSRKADINCWCGQFICRYRQSISTNDWAHLLVNSHLSTMITVRNDSLTWCHLCSEVNYQEINFRPLNHENGKGMHGMSSRCCFMPFVTRTLWSWFSHAAFTFILIFKGQVMTNMVSVILNYSNINAYLNDSVIIVHVNVNTFQRMKIELPNTWTYPTNLVLSCKGTNAC